MIINYLWQFLGDQYLHKFIQQLDRERYSHLHRRAAPYGAHSFQNGMIFSTHRNGTLTALGKHAAGIRSKMNSDRPCLAVQFDEFYIFSHMEEADFA